MNREGLLVAIDPGVHAAGVALYVDGNLVHARLARDDDAGVREHSHEWCSLGEAVFQVISKAGLSVFGRASLELAVEIPQIYAHGTKGDQNDLVALAGAAGALISKFDLLATRTTTYLPAEWKKSTKKEIMCRRVEETLREDEHPRVELPAPSLQHNVWDAVGIGLHHLGRLRSEEARIKRLAAIGKTGA